MLSLDPRPIGSYSKPLASIKPLLPSNGANRWIFVSVQEIRDLEPIVKNNGSAPVENVKTVVHLQISQPEDAGKGNCFGRVVEPKPTLKCASLSRPAQMTPAENVVGHDGWMDNDSTTMLVTSNWPCGSQPLLTRRSCLRPQPWLHRPTISGSGNDWVQLRLKSTHNSQYEDFILERLSPMASAPETARMPIFRQEGTLATPDLSFLRSPTCVDATIGRTCSLLGVRMFTLLPRITRTWVHGSVSAFMSSGRLFC
jgi:hypothetical protein